MLKVSANYPPDASSDAQDETTEQLRCIWQDVLGIPSVGTDQNYFELGGDSPLAVQLFARIEKVFNVKLPLATLFEAPTIHELAQILRGQAPESGWSSLVAIQPKGLRPAFFCIHPHGGNVLVYRDLSRHLGADQPFYGLQSLGLDGSCSPLRRIEDMAAQYVKDIRRVQPHGPYFLGGYCMGGTVAYEMAQQLRSRGEQIAILALIDTLNWADTPLPSLWETFVYTSERLRFHVSNFLSLDAADKGQFFRDKVATLRGRIPVWRSMLLRKFSNNSHRDEFGANVLAQIWKANFQACLDYVPKPYSGPVVDIRPAVQYRSYSKPELKWDRLAQGGQDVVALPVNPPAILIEPFVKYLALELRKSIDRALRTLEGSKRGSGLTRIISSPDCEKRVQGDVGF